MSVSKICFDQDFKLTFDNGKYHFSTVKDEPIISGNKHQIIMFLSYKFNRRTILSAFNYSEAELKDKCLYYVSCEKLTKDILNEWIDLFDTDEYNIQTLMKDIHKLEKDRLNIEKERKKLDRDRKHIEKELLTIQKNKLDKKSGCFSIFCK